MIKVSKPTTDSPTEYKTDLQRMAYEALHRLGIEYTRVDTEPAITMEDCEAVDQALGMKTVKSLFLTNRQKTCFYLCVLPGDKPFSTKDFSHALGVSRVSFAPAELLEQMMGTIIGATTIFSAMLDTAADVRIIVDSEVTSGQWYGCSDGTTTSYMKVSTADIFEKFLPSIGRRAEVVSL